MPDPRAHVGLYPGTFDPITRGHLDVIARGARLVERLVVGVAANVGKQPLMDLEERVECVAHEVAPIAAETARLLAAPDHLDAVLRGGAARARALAEPIVSQAERIVGFLK